MFVYSVKFVCGIQKDSDQEEPVRPGFYATEININNFHDTAVELRKLVIPVVREGEVIGREPGFVEPQGQDGMGLPPHSATMVDCFHIAELLFGGPIPAPMPLTIGVLEILSSDILAVTAVYTVTELETRSFSIDVEQIEGHRIG